MPEETIKALGVIPARGGSKGVRRKNIRQVAGEPLIAYSIRAARESRLLAHFLTTTDDAEIAQVARGLGCPVIMRPDALARDDTAMVPVVVHALEQAEAESGDRYDVIILLQPTAPIRTGEDIDNVIEMMRQDERLECVVSVCRVEDAHPARMYRCDEDGWLEPLSAEMETARRQDLSPVYHRNGVIYAVRRGVLLDKRTLMSDRKKAYVMPLERMISIDDERDLIVADVLVRRWKEGRL